MTESRKSPTPDTKAAREAHDTARGLLSPVLYNHSMRTYLLGAAYAERTGREFDEEGLYIAAMYHDLGMVPENIRGHTSFQQTSSRLMREFLVTHGFAGDRIRRLSDAIDYHMRLFPEWSRGNDAGLLQVGAWMDVMYLRRWAIWRRAGEIARAYPRKGLDFLFPINLLRTIRGPRSCAGLIFPAAPGTSANPGAAA